MDSQAAYPPKTLTSTRHKCSACFKQYKKKEHLIEHMKTSYHSVHQPKCGVCQKHCKSLESLREHLTGPLPNAKCSTIFADRGCNLCMKLFGSSDSLSEHKQVCCMPAPTPLGAVIIPCANSQGDSTPNEGDYNGSVAEAFAIDCEMVGGGSDGSLNLCARVCVIDEDENLIFHTYVQPQIPVTDYRHEVTGITEYHLRDAMPLKEVQERLLQILYNGESIGRVRLDGGKARLLVGHDLEHDLDCLRMNYPDHLLRDTAKYHPLMKTNFASHSLKYLTRLYLGYDIQTGVHDPFEDCVSVMRLYKRMRSQDHRGEWMVIYGAAHPAVSSIASSFEGMVITGAAHPALSSIASNFDSIKPKELENMTPNQLFEISRSNYRCWCLDSKQGLQI